MNSFTIFHLKRLTQLIILTGLLLLAVGAVSANTLPTDEADSFASGPLHSDGRITGVVTDPNGGPLAGVWVSAMIWDGEYGPYGVASAETNTNGFFDLRNLPYAEYRLYFYDQWFGHAYAYLGNTAEPNEATVLNVTDNTTLNVAKRLVPGAAISGQITLADGALLQGSVQAQRYMEYSGFWETIYYDWDVEDGRYRLTNLPAGSYRIFAEDYYGDRYISGFYNDGSSQAEATTIDVSTGEQITSLDFVLSPPENEIGGLIEGRVINADGVPLFEISVRLYQFKSYYEDEPPMWTTVRYEYTDGNGQYQFAGLEDGYYKVEFEDYNRVYALEYNNDMPTLGGAPEIVLSASSTGSGQIENGRSQTANATLLKGATIHGQIQSEYGRELAYVSFELFRWNHHDAYLPVNPGYDYLLDDSGNFAITGLQFGEYRVKMYAAFVDENGRYISYTKWLGNTTIEAQSQTVYVEPTESVSIGSIVMDDFSGTVSGRVTTADTDEPIVNATVTLQHANYYEHSSTFTDANGFYRFDGVPAGEQYTVTAYDPSGNYVFVWYGGGRYIEDATYFGMAVDETVRADLALMTAGKITGRMTTQDWFNFEYGYVSLYDANDEGLFYRSASVGADGYFSLDGLWPGDYKVQFYAAEPYRWDDTSAEAGEWYDDVASHAEAQTITVAGGEIVANINAELGNIPVEWRRTDGVISGVVQDENGEPLAGIHVYLFGEVYYGRGSYWGEPVVTTTGADGRYWFGNLGYSDYRIGFKDPNGQYLAEYWQDVEDFVDATDIEIRSSNLEHLDISATLIAGSQPPSTIIEQSLNRQVAIR